MIDEKDRDILNILQTNSRISNAEVARRIGMAPSAVLERIRKLEDRKIITSYETRLNHEKLGLAMTTFILVRTGEGIGSTEVGKRLGQLPQVQEVHLMTGDFAYLVKVRVRDTLALTKLLETFGTLGVKDSRTTLALKTVRETLAVDLAQATML